VLTGANLKVLCLYSIFFLSLFPEVAQAVTEQTVYPSGSSDQITINQALESAYQAGGGTVYLSAGIYNIDGQVKIGSNTVLIGDPAAIIRVSSSSSQWFPDGTGIIGAINEPLNNVEISGFQVDGNCKNLPRSYANSGAGDHNAERLIDLRASTGAYSNNISISNLRLVDAFSDGIHIAFARNVNINNVFASDCQHSALYYVDVLGGEISNNEVSGITSDCIRLDNCQYIKVHDNLLYSFTGDSNGAYETGQNGLQAGDQGFSHGGGSPKPDHTANLDIYNNTFAGKMLQAVCLDAAGKQEGNNVYVHDNKFVDVSGINTSGISFTNPPTVGMSENIFSSIFDILKQDFSFQYLDIQTPINASVTVTEYNNTYNPHSLVYVVGEGMSNVLYEYDGKSTNHYFSINGEKTDVWTGDLQHRGNEVYLPGNFDARKLQITCYNSQGYCKITDFNITEINDNSEQILKPELWAFMGTLLILGFSIYRNFRRVITRW